MLIALDEEDNRIEAWNAFREFDYFCQSCGSKMILKKGEIVSHHFAHPPNSPICDYWEPESDEHIEMKVFLKNYFSIDPYINSVLVEYKIGDKISDLYIEGRSGKRIAVECQASSKSIEDIIEKTEYYTKRDVATIWIFHKKICGYEYKESSGGYTLYRLPKMVLYIHDHFYDNRYYEYNSHRLIQMHLPTYKDTSTIRFKISSEIPTGKGIVILKKESRFGVELTSKKRIIPDNYHQIIFSRDEYYSHPSGSHFISMLHAHFKKDRSWKGWH